MELKVILDQLANWRRRHNIRHICLSIEGNGYGHGHGWDGREQVYVSGQFGAYDTGGE